MSHDGAGATGPTPNSSSIQVPDDDRIAEIKQLLAALDSARPDEMTAEFYQHGYWELEMAVRDLLRIHGHDPNS